MKFSSCLIALALSFSVSASPLLPGHFHQRRSNFTLKNGEDAIALNDKFKTLTTTSSCSEGEDACVNDQFAQCVGGKFVFSSCGAGAVCRALPLVNSAGTSVTCTTEAMAEARIAATGASDPNSNSSSTPPAAKKSANSTGSGGASGNNNSNPQTSLTLDPKVIASGFENNGQDVPAAGQVASLTSSNNFINFCLTSNKPIGNGKQVQTGSCNPAPMGIIAATTNMPSSKFVFPKNNVVIAANKTFTIQMAISHLSTGHFVNADSNYFAAPQQVDAAGDIVGHSHVVVEKITSLTQTEPTDPTKFAFFKGLNAAATNGILTADVTKGLAPGVYRLASINTAANHQPALVAVAQHGSLDDQVYFTVKN
jgi:hypothetical protein